MNEKETIIWAYNTLMDKNVKVDEHMEDLLEIIKSYPDEPKVTISEIQKQEKLLDFVLGIYKDTFNKSETLKREYIAQNEKHHNGEVIKVIVDDNIKEFVVSKTILDPKTYQIQYLVTDDFEDYDRIITPEEIIRD